MPRTTRSRSVHRFAMLLVLLPATACLEASADAAADLVACREARATDAADALTRCRAAADTLQAVADHDGAFESLMHAAELATRRSDMDAVDAVLARAQHLLPQVNDPLAAHRLHRRRGLLAYHRGEPVVALGEFLEALAAAAAGEGGMARAISHNDLGVVYQKLGDYAAALEQFQRSFELKGAQDSPETAPTLANIGGLYRRLGDPQQAERFLQRALAVQEAEGLAAPAARTREELGLLHQSVDDTAAAMADFDAAWEAFSAAGLARDQMRLALHRADLDAEHGDHAAARLWLQRARTAAAEIGRDPVLQADLLDLSVAEDAAAAQVAADALASNVERAGPDDPALAVDAYARLAAYHEARGDSAAALQALKAYVAHQEPLALARHDERLDALRVRFDVATLEADRDRLELDRVRQSAEIDRVRAQRFGVAVLGAVLLGLVALLFQRRLYRQRLAAEAERVLLQQRIAAARDAAEALRTDVRSLAWLLERGGSAALVFDAAGRVRAITPAAATRLGLDGVDAATGRTLAELVGPDAATWAQTRIEQASLDDATPLPPPADASDLRCERIAREEELGVLSWAPAAAASVEPSVDTAVIADTALDASTDTPASNDAFRAALVALMQSSLSLWERITLKTRIDLAERSGVWRITVDDGRLRVRAMDRYLGADTLPERPRWREVLRTAYFVLAELPLDAEQRGLLEAQIAQVQHHAPKRGA